MGILELEVFLLGFLATWLVYQDITQLKLSKSSFFFWGFLGVLIAFLTPLDSFLTLWLVFLGLSFKTSPDRTFGRHFFYSGFSVVLVDLFLTFFILMIYPVLFQDVILTHHQLLLVMLLPFIALYPIYRILKRLFRIDYSTILQISDGSVQRYIYGMNALFLIYYVIYFGLFFENQELAANFEQIALLLFLALLLYMVTLLNRKALQRYRQDMRREQDLYLENLENYSQHLEAIYQNMRSFKHDYDNILISLKDSIDSGDIEAIEEIYTEVLANASQKMSRDDYLFGQLTHLKNNAIKIAIANDLLAAQKEGLKISVAMLEDIEHFAIPEEDFLCLVQSMLAMAIHYAKSSRDEDLKLVISEQEACIKVMIDYSISVEKMVTNLLHDKVGRSLPIHSEVSEVIASIIKAYPNVQIESQSGDYRAQDTLVIQRLREG
ncbi:histidine kinase [Streptococcus acidominimus]|uniref:Histidine kinase n=1 Tax=Streptococcus acidominimus TaxID=1326 RepID=A0A239WDW8_STRAI|nr:hypothetical protein [Streptococcus acidominimus]SNV32805.1 histidine kinase [Streptococcus acidominimus]